MNKLLVVAFFLVIVPTASASTIQVDDDTLEIELNPGDEYNYSASFTVSDGPGTLWISTFSPYFDFRLISPPWTFPIPAEEQTQDFVVELKIPHSYPAGEYRNMIYFNIDDDDYITKLINVEVVPYKSVTVEPEERELDVSMGSKNCTSFLFNNTGNVDLFIDTEEQGIFYFNESVLYLYRGLEKNVSVCFNVPDNSTDIFEEFDLGNNVSTFNISLGVEDLKKPDIFITHPDRLEALEEFVLLVKATDNILVKSVEYSFLQQNGSLTYDSSSGFFKVFLTANKSGDQLLTVMVTDINKNENVTNKTLNIKCYSPEISDASVAVPQVKYDREALFNIMNTTHNMSIELNHTLDIKEEVNNTNCTFKMLADGSEFKEEVRTQLVGTLECDAGVEYELKVKMWFPDWVCESEKQVRFTGRVGAYDICEEIESDKNRYIMGNKITIEPHDDGTYSGSYCKVSTYLPIDTKDVEFGFSKSILSTVESNYKEDIEDLEKENAGLGLIITAGIVVIIILAALLVFMKSVYPKWTGGG